MIRIHGQALTKLTFMAIGAPISTHGNSFFGSNWFWVRGLKNFKPRIFISKAYPVSSSWRKERKSCCLMIRIHGQALAEANYYVHCRIDFYP